MTFRISIPQPCHEDWSKMTPKEKGKFCSTCQTIVTDFTLMSDAEIINHLQTASGKQCGKFNSFQLNRDLIEEKKSKSFWWSIPKFSAAASIVFSLLQIPIVSKAKTNFKLEQSQFKKNLLTTNLSEFKTESISEDIQSEKIITSPNEYTWGKVKRSRWQMFKLKIKRIFK